MPDQSAVWDEIRRAISTGSPLTITPMVIEAGDVREEDLRASPFCVKHATTGDWIALPPDLLVRHNELSRDVELGYASHQAVSGGVISMEELKKGPWDYSIYMDCWHRRSPEFIAERAVSQEALIQQRKDAEIALAAAMISLEGDLPSQRDGDPCAVAPNGQHYVSMACEFVYEGKSLRWSMTSANAIAAWKREMLEYAATHHGDILWWGSRPTIQGQIMFSQTTAQWLVYCRFAIGDSFIEQVKRGHRVPTCWDIQHGSVTEDEITALGLVFDLATGEYRIPAA